MARITVVNDYPAFLEMMDAMLREDGHEPVTFDGDRASLMDIRATRPDVLIIDVMAKGDGYTGWDVIGLARADDQLRRVPIVVCTAEVVQSGNRLDELAGTGDIHVLQKPFGSRDLNALIGTLLAGV
jgi:CheY-like chemotaxis protein